MVIQLGVFGKALSFMAHEIPGDEGSVLDLEQHIAVVVTTDASLISPLGLDIMVHHNLPPA